MRWLLAVLLLAVASVNAQTYFSGDWQYAVEAGEAILSGYTGNGGAITVPSHVDGISVKQIGNAWPPVFGYPNYVVTSITIPQGVRMIGNHAFYGCLSLTNVSLPISLTLIGEGAFQSCTSLSHVNIPNSVTTIRGWAFNSCTNLTRVTLPSTLAHLEESTFQICTSLQNMIIPNSVTSIGNSAFRDCSNLTTIIIGSGVTTIDQDAFFNCVNLTDARFRGNAPVSGGDWNNCPATIYRTGLATGWGTTFAGRPVVSEVWQYSVEDGEATITGYSGNGGVLTIPSEVSGVPVKYVGDGSNPVSGFEYASDTSISFPESVTTIKPYAFLNTTNLTNVIFSTGLKDIETCAFKGSGLVNVSIPNSVTNISSGVFWDCKQLTNVLLPTNITKIKSRTFQNSTNLISAVIPNGVTEIWDSAFFGCSNLVAVGFPLGLQSMWDSAFEGCSSINAISLPETIAYLGNSVFSGCANLRGVVFHGNAPGLGSNGNWDNCPANVYRFEDSTGWGSTFAARPVILLSGIFNKTKYDENRANGRSDVLNAPATYGLYSQSQYDANRTNGQSDILNNPNASGLYTTNQIHNLGLGGIVLNRNTNNQLVLNYQVLQSSDLQSWSPYQQTELVISNAPSDKMFLRVQAIENVTFSSQSDPLPGQPEGEGTPTNGPSPTPGAPTGGGRIPPGSP